MFKNYNDINNFQLIYDELLLGSNKSIQSMTNQLHFLKKTLKIIKSLQKGTNNCLTNNIIDWIDNHTISNIQTMTEIKDVLPDLLKLIKNLSDCFGIQMNIIEYHDKSNLLNVDLFDADILCTNKKCKIDNTFLKIKKGTAKECELVEKIKKLKKQLCNYESYKKCIFELLKIDINAMVLQNVMDFVGSNNLFYECATKFIKKN